MSEFDLHRFKLAQDPIYHRVVNELKMGQKQSHWMWYIFPQIEGLGHSTIAKQYAIKSISEARAYLKDPLLGGRLNECCELLLKIQNRSAAEILGFPDDLKLRSCMTLFAAISRPNSIFHRMLEHYYSGQEDPLTLERI